VAVNDLNLSPSEVREMTIGEINAVIWARTRNPQEEAKQDDLQELYEELMELRDNG
tara:strand:+ start:4062 stop:4229 length:168 start_codon:yes stop_codon:yes gene_type:complete